MVLFWLFMIITFLIVEAVSFNLITIWFAIGSLGAFITTYFTDDVMTQVIVFILITVISLVMTRSLVKKYINFKPEKTNSDAVIGKWGVVTKEIDINEYGRVRVDGRTWTAKASELINEGTKVEILGIEGVKLIVKKKEEK